MSVFAGSGEEKIYENSLVHRLRKKAVTVKQQHPIDVYDEDGTLLRHFVIDLLVEAQLVIELKACFTLLPEHTAQLLGYLRGCRLRHGMLINFGAPKLQIKKLILCLLCLLCLFVAPFCG